MRAPRVAVVVVNWNGGALLARCLAALAAQHRRADRVLVIDNASTDASAEGLERVYPGVEVLRQPRNLGYAAANNAGARVAADCDWLALVNPDAFPEPGWLAALLAAAARHPDVAALGSRLLQAAHPERLDGVGDAYHLSGLVWREGRGRRAAGAYLEERDIFSPCAAAALYRRDLFVALGGFDEDYFCCVEDVDLGFRLRLAGHRCRYVPDAVAHHQGGALTGVRSDFAVYHGHRNLEWTFVKNVPGGWFWVLLPLHLAASLAACAAFACLGQGHVAWRAKRDAWRARRIAWRKRTAIQAQRTAHAPDVLRAMRVLVWRRDLVFRQAAARGTKASFSPREPGPG